MGITEVEAKQIEIISDQAFVAMSFDPNLKSVYDNGLYHRIQSAGYKAFRVDRYDHIMLIRLTPKAPICGIL